MGPPVKFNEARKRKIIEAIALGCTYNLAASYAGVSESTVFRWLSSGREEEEGEYAEFYRSVKEAEAISAVRSLSSIVQAARDGNWTAAAWLLERRHGYVREPERPSIDLTVEVQNADVISLVEKVQEYQLNELITGPVIDLDEE